MEIVFDTQRGIPYEAILREQEERALILIVIASHGKTGILKNLLGGVVDKVTKRKDAGVACKKLLPGLQIISGRNRGRNVRSPARSKAACP